MNEAALEGCLAAARAWEFELAWKLPLMAAERGPSLGYSTDDLVRFLRTAAGSGPAGVVRP
ncbi:hypothetical protein [Streptomyces sp. NPDC059918]|uniref:hypothetical protein n=1 Tax=unclassified Streptomyces TaxID=2593676 RepID=UPI003648C986